MATSTANLGLIKPSGTDKIRIAQINQNMDIIDSAIGAAASGTTLQEQISSNNQAIVKQQESLAYIVGNTNTTGNTLAVGQFVYVKGHSTIAEGLRTVTASISANGNITTSNTSACSEGGLNALNSNMLHSIKSHTDYAFPCYASEVSDNNNKYIVQYNGIAVIKIIFDSNLYSQIAILLNGNYITPDNEMITSGGINLEYHRRYFQFPVFAGDEISVSFYTTYGVLSAKLRLLY